MSRVVKEIFLLSELLNNAYEIYTNCNSHEKEEIARKIFSELIFSEKGLQFKAKDGFDVLNQRFETVCDPRAKELETFSNRYKKYL